MSKLDKIKAEISFHKKMFFAALAVVIGLISWSAGFEYFWSFSIPFYKKIN